MANSRLIVLAMTVPQTNQRRQRHLGVVVVVVVGLQVSPKHMAGVRQSDRVVVFGLFVVVGNITDRSRDTLQLLMLLISLLLPFFLLLLPLLSLPVFLADIVGNLGSSRRWSTTTTTTTTNLRRNPRIGTSQAHGKQFGRGRVGTRTVGQLLAGCWICRQRQRQDGPAMLLFGVVSFHRVCCSQRKLQASHGSCCCCCCGRVLDKFLGTKGLQILLHFAVGILVRILQQNGVIIVTILRSSPSRNHAFGVGELLLLFVTSVPQCLQWFLLLFWRGFQLPRFAKPHLLLRHCRHRRHVSSAAFQFQDSSRRTGFCQHHCCCCCCCYCHCDGMFIVGECGILLLVLWVSYFVGLGD